MAKTLQVPSTARYHALSQSTECQFLALLLPSANSLTLTWFPETFSHTPKKGRGGEERGRIHMSRAERWTSAWIVCFLQGRNDTRVSASIALERAPASEALDASYYGVCTTGYVTERNERLTRITGFPAVDQSRGSAVCILLHPRWLS